MRCRPSLSLRKPDRGVEARPWQPRGECCDDRAMSLLTEDEIAAGLSQVAGWERTGSQIARTVKLGDFRDAMLYVGAVAHLPQSPNPHPATPLPSTPATPPPPPHS